MATRRQASQRTLTGSISDIQRRVKYLQNRQNPTRLGNQSVVRSAIQYQAVSTDQIAPNAIVNNQIQADAIDTTQIKNLSVTDAKLAQNAVVADKIKDGEVIAGKLGNAAVALVNMAPNSVDNGQLITDSVNFRTITTNAVGNENMQDNSVGNSELQNDSVGNGELQNNSVGFAELQSGSVGNTTLQNGAVTSSKIGSGQVGNAQLADLAVSGGKIANGTISGNKIADGAITGAKIAQQTINSGNITDAARTIIVRGGVNSGAGISVTSASNGVNILASFGGTDQNVARGNHRHEYLSSSIANVTRTTTAPVSSSRRLKKDITNFDVTDPKKILSIEPKKFKYKKPLKRNHNKVHREWMHGYIVEELLELGIEEPVGYDDSGNPESLMYDVLVVYIIEVLKEQQKEIEELRKEIAND